MPRVMDGAHTVCGHCAARIQDVDQATCPNCLEPLSVRTFASEQALEDFRDDRRVHGAPVPDQEAHRRPGLSLALAFVAAIMFMAAVGISFSGVTSGSWAQATRSLGQAVVPFAIALGMAAVARKYGGGSG